MNSARSDDIRRGDRPIELLAVILLGLATVGSAWCAFQASKWNNEQDTLAREASDAKVEGVRQFGLVTQQVAYDANLVAEYAKAVIDGDDRLRDFLRNSLFRPNFLPILDEWQARVDAGERPPNLLQDQEYLDGLLGPYREAEAHADALLVQSQQAGKNADDYIATTLLLASALFFAGVTTSFRVRFARLLLLTGAALIIAFVAMRLTDLPVA